MIRIDEQAGSAIAIKNGRNQIGPRQLLQKIFPGGAAALFGYITDRARNLIAKTNWPRPQRPVPTPGKRCIFWGKMHASVEAVGDRGEWTFRSDERMEEGPAA